MKWIGRIIRMNWLSLEKKWRNYRFRNILHNIYRYVIKSDLWHSFCKQIGVLIAFVIFVLIIYGITVFFYMNETSKIYFDNIKGCSIN